MICFELPLMAVALIPVAWVESVVYRAVLNIDFRTAFRGALRANLWSTFLGIPLAWLIQVVAQMTSGGGAAWGLDTPLTRLAAVTLQSAWLVPYERDLYWMIPVASFVLLIPCFVASVVTESLVLIRRWNLPRARLLLSLVLANAASYLLLAAYLGIRVAAKLPSLDYLGL